MEEEDMSFEDIAEENSMHLEALMELLKQKGIITQEEIDKKIDELYPDEE